MRRHEWLAAAVLLERDILERPSDLWSRMYLGSCHYELRNFEVALEQFCVAERLAPNDSTPIGLQGDVFDARGDWEKAGDLYKRALALNPDDPLAQKNVAGQPKPSGAAGADAISNPRASA